MIGPDPNFEVFNEEIEITLKELGEAIGSRLPPNWGFTLLLYDFNNADDGKLFYASNGDRRDVTRMLKEFIALLEKQDLPPEPRLLE
jgi:hypothetical protein